MSNLDLDIDIPFSTRAKNAVESIQRLAADLATEALAVEISRNMNDLSGIQDLLGKLNCQHSILAVEHQNATAALIYKREAAAIAEHGDLA